MGHCHLDGSHWTFKGEESVLSLNELLTASEREHPQEKTIGAYGPAEVPIQTSIQEPDLLTRFRLLRRVSQPSGAPAGRARAPHRLDDAELSPQVAPYVFVAAGAQVGDSYTSVLPDDQLYTTVFCDEHN